MVQIKRPLLGLWGLLSVSMAVRGIGKVSAVLLDLSGTLHVESTPTPSAVAALTR